MKFRPALDGAYGVSYLVCVEDKDFRSGEYYFDGEV